MKLPKYYYNTISYIGTIIAGINIFLIISLSLLFFIRQDGSLYGGVYIYIILPIFLVSGLLMIPIGMWLNIRRIKKSGEEKAPKRLKIDFNDPTHRNAFAIFIIGTVIFIFFTGIVSYEAFHYTESNEFCGKVCHKVMEPEYLAYQNLSHANVPCVDCHIGQGADWFVKAKISGLYQVYAVLSQKYPKPIPTPIVNLRPARETCERCHWPKKFYSNLLVGEKHFLSDKQNTEWDIQLRMKVGPLHSSKGLEEGIHWHINENVKIEYFSSPDREDIRLVKYINLKTNDTIIYENEESSITDEELLAIEPREMDCMDCHNRPSHKFLPPQDFVEHAMASGEIPKNLPAIKQIAMQTLIGPFESTDTAMIKIENDIMNFYKEDYPEVYAKQKYLIIKAIEGIQNEFKKNIFPKMHAAWDVYPDHIGHVEYNGCFRCHFGNHKSKEGKTISKDCNKCHTILAQGKTDSLEAAPLNSSLEFKHPVNIDLMWKEVPCAECHRNLY